MKKLYKTIIEENFNQAQVTKLGEGNHSIAYDIDNQYVIKVAKNDDACVGLQNEANILKLIEGKVSANVPKIIKIDYVEVGNQKVYYTITTKVKGKSLTPKQYNKLGKSQKDKIARDVAKFLIELHSIKPNQSINKIDYVEQLKNMLKVLKANYFNRFSIDKQKKITTYINNQIEYFSNLKINKGIIHNDFSAENILFENNEFVGVIDFGDAGIGDLDNDSLCLCEESDEEFGVEFGKLVLKHYNHKSIDLVLEKTRRKDEIWPLEELYYGYLYQDEEMINEALETI